MATAHTLIINVPDTDAFGETGFYRVADDRVTAADVEYLRWAARGFSHPAPEGYPHHVGGRHPHPDTRKGFLDLQAKAERLPPHSCVFENVSRVFVIHDTCM